MYTAPRASAKSAGFRIEGGSQPRPRKGRCKNLASYMGDKMFTVRAPDGRWWFLPSLVMARKFAWRKSWRYPADGELRIFKGKTLVAIQTIWRGGPDPTTQRTGSIP